MFMDDQTIYSTYRFWYDLKNSGFQYDQRMAKYPFDVRVWLTVSY